MFYLVSLYVLVCCRKQHESGTKHEIASVHNKLQVATSTLQQAIGGISQNVTANSEKVGSTVRLTGTVG